MVVELKLDCQNDTKVEVGLQRNIKIVRYKTGTA